MNTLFQSDARASINKRLDGVSADASARWGKLNAPQMMVHIAAQMQAALGDLPTKPRKTPFTNWLLRRVVVFWLPWPKGRLPTAPEFLATPPGVWEADKQTVRDLVKRFEGGEIRTDWAPHPAFGVISAEEWGKLAYKHLDHHLRQFGA